MFKTIAGIFLILHGLVHVGLAVGPRPEDAEKKPFRFFTSGSWLLSRLKARPSVVRALGIFMVSLAAGAFVVSGICLLAANSIWSTAAVVGALVSLALLALYWHAYLPIGVVIDLAVFGYSMFLS
jgi:hypothetical protein